ncbi:MULTISPECIES: HAD-IIIC family phosphatase [unclassified Streptomyces]|uniref:HAD-IIIC family phosphatase n=1 Tax=unclassified Streptomyces TaxID=2593676 RepID=UPI002DD80B10|nr:MULTISPECIES: HAD-IIIC family phosphatase [unclassified Streptomyces]WSA90511.1 HAD-IIIC family phosphatase [Streptomyces sp. NBC_01795]WSB74836.1 HAD-IIIC family phosphatase [Streptomyces sp. NBC_01775]WSS16881.1 HAD-IIIC family phosphatase [Streptomyces sp. NBC_01186]WSS45624.1 HAD-IIIC family phosphatase [Streptomyces sp. NBC_01187]
MNSQQPVVKCLVWDLDNTLWRGTLLEDGEAHLGEDIAAVVKGLDSRGILQSVASKNEYEPVWAHLESLGLAEYFVVPQIGWGAKSEAVRRIAEQLNFSPDTLAFIDDQPAERAEVSFHLPEVRCYPAEHAPTLLELQEFSPRTITVDSRRRREMYQANIERETRREAYPGPDEQFLRTLGLRLRLRRADDAELSRVEELTLRTSQMNATGVHYSDADLRDLCADPAHEVLVATLTDRFGPHGAIGVLLLNTDPRRWHVKLLATSCRVVSFGVGAAILNWLTTEAFRAGVHLVADFRATSRNRMMDIAYRFAGFTDESCECAASLPSAADIQRLHMLPEPRTLPPTMRFDAPDLGQPSGT